MKHSRSNKRSRSGKRGQTKRQRPSKVAGESTGKHTSRTKAQPTHCDSTAGRGEELAGDTSVPDEVRKAVSTAGRPLPGPVKAKMERRFGCSLAHVQLHTDTLAAAACQKAGADGLTVGNHILIDANSVDLDTEYGERVIAHELTHVIQQTNGTSVHTQSQVGSHGVTFDPQLEREAEQTAQDVADGKTVDSQQIGSSDVSIQPMMPQRSNPAARGIQLRPGILRNHNPHHRLPFQTGASTSSHSAIPTTSQSASTQTERPASAEQPAPASAEPSTMDMQTYQALQATVNVLKNEIQRLKSDRDATDRRLEQELTQMQAEEATRIRTIFQQEQQSRTNLVQHLQEWLAPLAAQRDLLEAQVMQHQGNIDALYPEMQEGDEQTQNHTMNQIRSHLNTIYGLQQQMLPLTTQITAILRQLQMLNSPVHIQRYRQQIRNQIEGETNRNMHTAVQPLREIDTQIRDIMKILTRIRSVNKEMRTDFSRQ